MTQQTLAAYVLFGAAVIVALWATSQNLRQRITVISQEVGEHVATGADTSSGARLDFWRYSLRIVSEAPVIGHGTGTIADEFRRHASGSAVITATNPHSQVFTVAIQLGAVGLVILSAMWAVHWLMFTAPGLSAWFGLMVVTQSIISCQFNSHLLDFTQGWLYVFGVGVFGGAVRGRKAERMPGEAPTAAAARGP